MKIQLKNLGPLCQAEFELADFTIICGNNNTGKTYATYALYGFLDFWRSQFISLDEQDRIQLFQEGTLELDIRDYIKKAEEFLIQACKDFKAQLPLVFASSEKHFADSEFFVELDLKTLNLESSFNFTVESPSEKTLLFISKARTEPIVSVSLLFEHEEEGVKMPDDIINQIIGDALKKIIFSSLFSRPVIVSAERTGAAIFWKELNVARSRFLV